MSALAWTRQSSTVRTLWPTSRPMSQRKVRKCLQRLAPGVVVLARQQDHDVDVRARMELAASVTADGHQRQLPDELRRRGGARPGPARCRPGGPDHAPGDPPVRHASKRSRRISSPRVSASRNAASCALCPDSSDKMGKEFCGVVPRVDSDLAAGAERKHFVTVVR